MNANQEDKELALSIFTPLVHCNSCESVVLNKAPTQVSLYPFNLYRMSGLVATSRNPQFYTLSYDVMLVIRSFLHSTPIYYDNLKDIWTECYTSKLLELKKEDEFDLNWYSIGSMDYQWAINRITSIDKALESLNQNDS